jgi:predicted ester cyclase
MMQLPCVHSLQTRKLLMHMMIKLSFAIAFFAACLITPPAYAIKQSDSMAFVSRVCDLYQAPVETATFPGGSTGCTWKIGDGERGVTSTEIMMVANREAGAEVITAMTTFFDTSMRGLAMIPGYREEDTDIVCDNGNSIGRIVFWGEPTSGNMMGYAICGNNMLSGEIHYPPADNAKVEMETLFRKLMQSMVPLLDGK